MPASSAGNFRKRSYFFFFATFLVFFAVFFTALFAFFAFLAFLAMLPSKLVSDLVAACTRESKCTASRIHQHIEKNTVLLNEVLPCRRERSRCTSIDDATTRLRNDANSARKCCTGNCQYRRKHLCHRCFRYHRIKRTTRAQRYRDSPMPRESTSRGL